jgi:gas vesicle protein
MNTNVKVVIGLLTGIAIGSITALLMAPASGLRTRKNLNKKAKKLVKQIEGLMGKQTKRRVSTSHAKNGRASVAAR